MDCKQRTLDKLPKTLAVCLQRESLIRDENIFLLLNSNINSNTQNFDKSELSATQDNKALDVNNAPLDKDNRESIDDNSCNSNECNKISDKIANDNSKKKLAGLTRITRITLIALTTQEQCNMIIAELYK